MHPLIIKLLVMSKNTFENAILIDDNKVSNFFNKVALLNMGITKNIQIFDNCLDAINFFIGNNQKNNLFGDVIFLDLYTPYMNGWEFLEKLSNLPVIKKLKVVIMHDNNSILPEEEMRLYQYPFVECVTNKQLDTPEVLNLLNGNHNAVAETFKMTS